MLQSKEVIQSGVHLNTLPDYWVENTTVGSRVGPEVSKDLAGVRSRQGMMVVQARENSGEEWIWEMYWSRDRQINDLTSEWTGSGELCWISSPLPLWWDPLGPRAPGWYSQAEPLHHALPRLGWCGTGIGSRFNLTGEGVAGERGEPVRTELGKWTDLNPQDSLASFERKALTVQSQDMDYVVLWQRSECRLNNQILQIDIYASSPQTPTGIQVEAV